MILGAETRTFIENKREHKIIIFEEELGGKIHYGWVKGKNSGTNFEDSLHAYNAACKFILEENPE